MRLSKMLLAATAITMLFSILAASTSARELSSSSSGHRAIFNRLDFSGGFGTVECEIVIEGSFHNRTTTKVAGTLLGYITAGNVTRCATGGATIDRATLPWHRRYNRFTGTLPNISTFSEIVTGIAYRIREPVFRITCQVTNATETRTYTRNTATGVITDVSVSSTAPCSGIGNTISGITTNLDNGSGARITVTLI